MCCSFSRRLNVKAAVERMGLQDFFRAKVTAEDGMETISQRFLSASLKLGRAPNQCVVFESSPSGVTAAHNCTMKVWRPAEPDIDRQPQRRDHGAQLHHEGGAPCRTGRR
jgi:beta-phosphoglucomutase-like phosphatase (HAD superfamily)